MPKKYKEGDLIGPYKIQLIKRTEKTPSGHWKGIFLCPNHTIEDPHYFEADITNVARGRKKECSDCTGWASQKEDLTGQVFNRLTVIKKTNKTKDSSRIYLCQCSCGQIKEVRAIDLKRKLVQSCGCLAREHAQQQAIEMGKQNQKDLTNQRSGTWTAIKQLDKRKNNSCVWLCKCENGHYNEITTGNWGKIKTCRQCKTGKSLGEEKIQKILQNLHIYFIEEYSFTDCVYKKPLRFDFYLPDYNCCIEYDGIQHFEKTSFSHDNFEERQKRDSVKNKYCLDKKIKLIRVPYTDIDLLNEQYILDRL